MVDGAGHGEQQVGQAVDVVQQLRLERLVAERDHGALRPAADGPRDVQSRSGGSTAGEDEAAQRRQLASSPSIQRSSRATSSVDDRGFRDPSGDAMRGIGETRADGEQVALNLQQLAGVSSASGVCATARRPARHSARRCRRRRRLDRPTSARACRRTAPCPPNRRSWYRFSPAQLFHFRLAKPSPRMPDCPSTPQARSPQPRRRFLPPPNARRLFRRRLLEWYRRNGRDLPWRHTRDPYQHPRLGGHAAADAGRSRPAEVRGVARKITRPSRRSPQRTKTT